MNLDNITFFFKDPFALPEIPGRNSLLYLLRRDILTCFAINPDTKKKIKYKALFPGVMGIFAGIDLLGKFLAGNDSPKSSGSNFKKYLKKYFQLTGNETEILYQLRNAIVHSFGLYSKNKEGKEYKFTLCEGGNIFIQSVNNQMYIIELNIFHNKFNSSILLYKSDLLKDKTLQENFDKMFKIYSLLNINN